MIYELIVGKFISIIKGEETPEQIIQKSKDRINKWYQNKIGDWTRVISVEENKEDVLKSIIKVETWDTIQFSPIHYMAYSNMAVNLAYLKNNYKKIKNK